MASCATKKEKQVTPQILVEVELQKLVVAARAESGSPAHSSLYFKTVEGVTNYFETPDARPPVRLHAILAYWDGERYYLNKAADTPVQVRD